MIKVETPASGQPTGSSPTTRDVAEIITRTGPAYQAFVILRAAFTIAPIVFGLDKFFGILVDWDRYLSPAFASVSPLSVHHTMYVVGVIEIVAGVVVALHPRLGSIVVTAWLFGIIVNLLLIPGYYDVALRDFGLLLAAVALQRLSMSFDVRPATWPLHARRG